MLDQIINTSFELDYQIYHTLNLGKCNNFLQNLNNYKIDSNDIFKQYEILINNTKEILSELMEILLNCNEQRMNFRILLIKLMKDKIMIEKLLREEDNTLILNKLLIHDELKNYFIDKSNSRTIPNSVDKKLNIDKYSNYSKSNNILSIKNDYLGDIRSKALINCSTISTLNKHKNLQQSPNTSSHNHSSVNDSHTELKTGINLNLDFNTEKYHIISNSPIHTPNNKKSKVIIMSKKKPNPILKKAKSIDYEDPLRYDSIDHNSFIYNQTEIEDDNFNIKNSAGDKFNIEKQTISKFKKSEYVSPFDANKKGNLKSIANIHKDIVTSGYNRSPTSTIIMNNSNDRISLTSTKKRTTLNYLSSKTKK